MYKGPAGANNLNRMLQQSLNKRETLLHRGERIFKMNDKVMQLRNNYDKDIFNGDIGYVTGVSTGDQIIRIRFDRKIVELDFSELDEITHAYAVSVHKSQGSEYPCVILPMTTSHYVMLQRNLLYTAITRAKELMIIVGTKKAVSIAVRNSSVRQRYTSLFKTLNW
jgi:exodeoxyribonuclease V alpha subunit